MRRSVRRRASGSSGPAKVPSSSQPPGRSAPRPRSIAVVTMSRGRKGRGSQTASKVSVSSSATSSATSRVRRVTRSAMPSAATLPRARVSAGSKTSMPTTCRAREGAGRGDGEPAGPGADVEERGARPGERVAHAGQPGGGRTEGLHDRHGQPPDPLQDPFVQHTPVARRTGVVDHCQRLRQERARHPDHLRPRTVGLDLGGPGQLDGDVAQDVTHEGIGVEPLGLDPDVGGQRGQRLGRVREPHCGRQQWFGHVVLLLLLLLVLLLRCPTGDGSPCCG